MLPPRHARQAIIAAIAMLATLVILSGQTATAQRARFAPEGASGFSGRDLAVARTFMVSAANPLAVDAGLAMLRQGGSAVDAAIAVQLVLNLVEPQSSGIGGGAFLLHWDARLGELQSYDGRERAPMTATADRFIRDGSKIPFGKAVNSGLSIGVPGLVKLLEHVHRKHGRLPWRDLFVPAIKLTTEGFEVSSRLSLLLSLQGADAFDAGAKKYFFDGEGRARPAGHRLTNLAFAATLRAIASEGSDAFYGGAVAGAIVEAAKGAPNFAGDITAADLAAYAVVERSPVCSTYRGYRICGMGPPSSGALTVAQTLALIEPFDVGQTPDQRLRPSALHLIAEAQKLAYADRNRYIGDPDHVAVPTGLLDPGYIAERRALIDRRRAAASVRPGLPPGVDRRAFGRDGTVESVGTSHISIVDANGNAVSMTTTIESAFGSGVWAAGFLLNNELTDFDFSPRDASGRPVANAVGPGKRPRSSMAPTIVFGPDGKVFAVLGSPGGSRIILYVTKSLIGLIDWQLDAQAATELINFGSRGGPFEIELNPAITSGDIMRLWRVRPSIWHAMNLKPFGHVIRPDLMTSGLHVIVARDGVLTGGADPRREGVAKGD